MNIEVRNKVLSDLGELIKWRSDEILQANKVDINNYTGEDPAMSDRLIVDEKKVRLMIKAINDMIEQEDPLGQVLYRHDHPNGLQIENRTVAFGRILIIYESRPDVTIEAAITAFKAGNKILLKGGKESRNTNLLLTQLWHDALKQSEMDTEWVTYLDLDRKATQLLIRENSQKVDMIIPRGGEGLISFVQENSSVPVIVSGRGNNFLFIDRDSDFSMAQDLIIDGKKRISVCNALDKVLIDRELPQIDSKLDNLISDLRSKSIQVLADDVISSRHSADPVNQESVYYEEFLDSKILLCLTDNLDTAIDVVNKYSGGHSATIVSNNRDRAERFLNEVDCAAVYHNASTRFTDGGQFGFGAELAISTQKLHFRGPIGVNQLVTNKWFINGNGQTRS